MTYRPIYVRLFAADGVTPEATAYARNGEHVLPDGTWLIRSRRSDVEELTVDEMPAHWQRQLAKWSKFAETI